MKQSAKNTLESLRGGKWLCGCGRKLIPLYNKDGKRIGVTHRTIEDDDWHNVYFAGISVETLGES